MHADFMIYLFGIHQDNPNEDHVDPRSKRMVMVDFIHLERQKPDRYQIQGSHSTRQNGKQLLRFITGDFLLGEILMIQSRIERRRRKKNRNCSIQNPGHINKTTLKNCIMGLKKQKQIIYDEMNTQIKPNLPLILFHGHLHKSSSHNYYNNL